MTHTPGPWTFESSGVLEGQITGPAEGRFVPIVAAFSHIQSRADGRLMAAAPDLLHVCELMLGLHDSGSWGAPPGEYMPLLRAALAKAGGQ